MTLFFSDLSILIHTLHSETKSEAFSWLRVMKQFRFLQARVRQRRQLMQLSDRQLQDIGISRVDALQEATKPFWQD